MANTIYKTRHLFRFDVNIVVGGCGTTSYATVRKTVIANSEEEARQKLSSEIELYTTSMRCTNRFM